MRNLEIDEANGRPRSTSKAKEVELKQREVELKLISKDNLIITADLTTLPLERMVWFE
jgi:phage-related protein